MAITKIKQVTIKELHVMVILKQFRRSWMKKTLFSGIDNIDKSYCYSADSRKDMERWQYRLYPLGTRIRLENLNLKPEAGTLYYSLNFLNRYRTGSKSV